MSQKLKAYTEYILRELELNEYHFANIYEALRQGQRVFIGTRGLTVDLTKTLSLMEVK